MIEASLLLPLLMGIVLGALFFGGLWWTVQRAASVRWVGLWFFSSLLLRTAAVLTGFYLSCGDDWRRWLAALLGFSMARLIITRLTRTSTDRTEAHRAS